MTSTKGRSLLFATIIIFSLAALLLIAAVGAGRGSALAVSGEVCWEGIANGSFEEQTAWTTLNTPWPADYSQVQKSAGSWSMRTGIEDLGDRVESYSTAYQQVTIPNSADPVTLKFKIFPQSDEPDSMPLPLSPLGAMSEDAPTAGDAQMVLILNQYGVELERLFFERRDDREWLSFSFDLSHYKGQTIKVYFGTYNNNLHGVTAMYVDEVSLGNCADVDPTPTPTPTATAVPTETPLPSPTPSCEQWIVNPGFENRDGWILPASGWPAGYSDLQALSGAWSMRAGILDAGDNVLSDSAAYQQVTIPAGADPAWLRFNLYPQTTETNSLIQPLDVQEEIVIEGDSQHVLLRDENGDEIMALLQMRSNAQKWGAFEFDLTTLAGETLQIYFGVFNDGEGGVTSMFVDEVVLTSCSEVPPQPTPSPTPGPLTEETFLPAVFSE